jgi:hypothetical protein
MAKRSLFARGLFYSLLFGYIKRDEFDREMKVFMDEQKRELAAQQSLVMDAQQNQVNEGGVGVKAA